MFGIQTIKLATDETRNKHGLAAAFSCPCVSVFHPWLYFLAATGLVEDHGCLKLTFDN